MLELIFCQIDSGMAGFCRHHAAGIIEEKDEKNISFFTPDCNRIKPVTDGIFNREDTWYSISLSYEKGFVKVLYHTLRLGQRTTNLD